MNIIELTNEELNTVIAWRDENKEVVRDFKPFLVGGRIVVSDNFELSFSVFPQGDRYSLTLKYYAKGVKVLTVEALTSILGVCKVADVRGTKAYQKARFTNEQKHALVQDMIGVFFAVNAYFLHGITTDEEIPEKVAKTHGAGEKKAEYKRAAVKHLNKIYTIRGKRAPTENKGTRARHCEAWEVVGHYRHYKNGRVVYIAPYYKGKNKNAVKGKTYKF